MTSHNKRPEHLSLNSLTVVALFRDIYCPCHPAMTLSPPGVFQSSARRWAHGLLGLLDPGTPFEETGEVPLYAAREGVSLNPRGPGWSEST